MFGLLKTEALVSEEECNALKSTFALEAEVTD